MEHGAGRPMRKRILGLQSPDGSGGQAQTDAINPTNAMNAVETEIGGQRSEVSESARSLEQDAINL
jgi:hypothetical protein